MEAAEKLLGVFTAELLISMLADIEALDDGNQLMALFGNDAKIAENGSLSIAIGADYSAMFVAVGEKFPRLPDGKPDWTRAQRMKLVEISKCH
jgi:hypothetical protein